jgi:4a-hydroxytetrahydrobiopterin dehydratase
MPTALADKSCTACRGSVQPLAQAEAEKLQAQAPGWELLDATTRVARTYRFGSFRNGFEFLASAATLAEAEAHHPDVSFGWSNTTVALRTENIKGLHENFIVAAKPDCFAKSATTAPR